jgi:hypothetical protein
MVTEGDESAARMAANSVELLAVAMVEGRGLGKGPVVGLGCKEAVVERGYMEAGE